MPGWKRVIVCTRSHLSACCHCREQNKESERFCCASGAPQQTARQVIPASPSDAPNGVSFETQQSSDKCRQFGFSALIRIRLPSYSDVEAADTGRTTAE